MSDVPANNDFQRHLRIVRGEDARQLGLYGSELPASGEEIKAMYDGNFLGTLRDEDAEAHARDVIPAFHIAHPEVYGAAEKEDVITPHNAIRKYEPEFGGTERQTDGDCVSHGAKNAGKMAHYMRVYFGRDEDEGPFATENIYAERGHRGAGANCARLATYVSSAGKGGFLYRRKYTGPGGQEYDLSRYNSSIGARLGGQGNPSWVNELAAQNKAADVFRCETVKEADDALFYGCGLMVCSGLSFSETRDGYGVARRTPQGWAHCMACLAKDASRETLSRYQQPIYLIIQSWGSWNRGGVHPEIWTPTGSFWILEKDFGAMVRSGGTHAVGAVETRLSRSEAVERAEILAYDATPV